MRRCFVAVVVSLVLAGCGDGITRTPDTQPVPAVLPDVLTTADFSFRLNHGGMGGYEQLQVDAAGNAHFLDFARDDRLGEVKIDFVLSPAEMTALRRAIAEVDFVHLPREYERKDNISDKPSATYELTLGRYTKRVTCVGDTANDLQRIDAVVDPILRPRELTVREMREAAATRAATMPRAGGRF
jgi:hypothetical protein